MSKVIIDKVTTKTGDTGSTLGFHGKKISKADDSIELLGILDELNAVLGMAQYHTQSEEIIMQVQRLLFEIGAQLYTGKPKISDQEILWLEQSIAQFVFPTLTSFIIPSGAASHWHVARAVCRRAERYFWKLEHSDIIIGQFLNRLSDLLFMYSRQYDQQQVVW